MRISDWSSDVCSSDLLFRIASNLMLDRQRRNTVRTRAKLEQDVNWLPGSAECSARSVTPEEHLHNCQTLDKIAQVLGEMPDMMKDVFLLVRLEGMKQNEVSAMLGISISLVEKHLAKAAARLRSEEHTSELQSLMRSSYAVFCLKQQQTQTTTNQ